MILKKHLSDEQGLADLLNYAHLIDDGVIINKDGAFIVSFKFRGPDLNSADGEKLDAITATVNRMACFLEDGWMLHVDELRVPSLNYAEQGNFPNRISKLIDEERRSYYEAAGMHYENLQILTFVWKFPLPLVKTAKHWFIEGLPKATEVNNLNSLLQNFYDVVERCTGLLSTHLYLEKLNSADLLTYLNTCITGELLPIAVPPDECFIDVVLGRRNVIGGYIPRIGDKHIYVLSIIGYLNSETMPGLLDELCTYAMVYRWSNRFIPLSASTAEKEIKRYQKNWNNKIVGLMGIIKESLTGTPATKTDKDAIEMSSETDEALRINANHSARFGYWTSEIVLMDENIEMLEKSSKTMRKYLEQLGFTCIKEDINAFDAWLGSIPGHGSANVRKMFINSINLAHLLPLNSIWAGNPHSSKESFLPQKSPPVFYAATTGNTPFRFNLDVRDVGHQTVIGPTGSGKTTYLQFLIAQFFRYQDAQVFIFDKDYSHLGITAALDGMHYDLGNDDLSFCPLADLSTERKKVRAGQFIEDLIQLQNVEMTPDIRAAINNAIRSLSDEAHQESRNLTVFRSEVQNEFARAAISYYTIEGQIKSLDATKDNMKFGHLQTFEMNWLLSQREEIYLPHLRYIFDQIESRLEEANGKKPTLIILEEAWAYVSHPIFAKKLMDWLKTLRKQNARVIFVTQSLSDLYDPGTKSLTSTTASIIEACFTKVYLPNESIDAEIKKLYKQMGLSDRQIEIINQVAIPKKDYYVVTPEGDRLIELGLSNLALSFIGLSIDKAKNLVQCKKNHGEKWLAHWLNENNQINE